MAKQEIRSDLVVENAKIIFRNFSGKSDKYNPQGFKTFCLLLEDDAAEMLQRDGWNIRWLPPREEGDSEQAFTNIRVNYDGYRKPKVVTLTSFGKTYLDQDTINMLDWAEIEKIDLVINPSYWEVGDKSGLKGYLKSMYVTLIEDPFESKYRDVQGSINDGPPPWED
jgi:hypothetical protein